MPVPETETDGIDRIKAALGDLNTWLTQAVIRTDSANSFNAFVRSVLTAEGGRLLLRAPHGKDGRIEMGYVSESYLRMER